MHRIFVAIPISEILQGQIFEWENKFLMSQPSFAKASAGKLRWLAGKNLHITLIPPWYADEEQMTKSREQIAEAIVGIKPFDMVFEKVMYGPDPKRPRLIWAEGKVPQEILKLKKNLEIALERESEKHPFLLHLTVARFREEDFYSFPVKKIDDEVFWPEKAGSVVLMESRLSSAGADYKILDEIKLG